MEREQIAKMATAMADKNDLLELLNKIKHDEMIAVGFGDKFYFHRSTSTITAILIMLSIDITSSKLRRKLVENVLSQPHVIEVLSLF